jgi:plasmid stability protein
MATLQVRSIDDQLYRALGARATLENRSISQEVIAIIKDYLSRPSSQHPDLTAQFLQLCGTWQDDRGEDVIAADVRRSRVQSNERFGDVL